MSSTETALRHRGNSPGESQLHEPASTEELLIEKLDIFLSSIEHRLASFEQYFQLTNSESLNNAELSEDLKSKQQSHSRRSSITLIKSYSIDNMSRVYEQLKAVKNQMLKTSSTNLDYLYNLLDDKYKDLFSEASPESESAEPQKGVLNKELVSRKIITTIQYFELKLTDIDNIIKSKTPQATANYDEDERFNRFRFFNFNKALKDAESNYIHYYQLPLSWRENRYIVHGYRFTLHHTDILKLVFHFRHNEAGNIWTHLIGGILVLWVAFFHFPSTSVFKVNSFGDNAVMYAFLAAALQCMISSVFWHTYLCFANLSVRNRFACVDYTGITVLITCLVILAEYCALYQYPTLLTILVGLSVAAGAGGFFFNWLPYFDRPDCRPLRIGFFVSLALLGGSTVFFKAYYEGIILSLLFYAPITYKSLLWYWVGVVFYGGLIPERWRYDVIINEDESCRHAHSSLDVFTGHIEHSGEEELADLKQDMQAIDQLEDANVLGQHYMPDGTHPDAAPGADLLGIVDDEMAKYQEVLAKHFPAKPLKTPYAGDFLSLWWVDYIFQSHNIWHVFVVLGVLGHYSTVVGMFEKIPR